MAQVYVSVGSNIARRKNIAHALDLLAGRYGELQLSGVYESEAVGFDSAPFYNMVIGFHTDDPPRTVQRALHDIEARCGRVRTATLSARTIDLDLLLYADLVIEEDGMLLPRDDITRYAFVLYPLSEIAPDGRHPVSGRPYAELWAEYDGEDANALQRVDWSPLS
ncbi:MAG: 2-amino-4-hydroxy-6-hydroxymethyldihydropteridine diphosphokinase [Thiohalobacterales bacterium]|nr:2-amino-4-hydroxy-6-hydroxymethyldihydropteridine diphosphokinase [Thiohalobacterales bacterium]